MSCPSPEPITPATDLVLALVRAVRTLKAHLDENVDDTTSYVLLHDVGASGPVRTTDLAVLIGLDHSTVSRHVARQLDAGTIARLPDPTDGRASRLELTAAGRAALEEALQRRAGIVAAATATWTPSERAALVELLDRLTAAIDSPQAIKEHA